MLLGGAKDEHFSCFLSSCQLGLIYHFTTHFQHCMSRGQMAFYLRELLDPQVNSFGCKMGKNQYLHTYIYNIHNFSSYNRLNWNKFWLFPKIWFEFYVHTQLLKSELNLALGNLWANQFYLNIFVSTFPKFCQKTKLIWNLTIHSFPSLT